MDTLKFAASLMMMWMTRILQTMVDSHLFTAAKNGHFVIFKLIIDHVYETNPADNNGSTPLYIAAQTSWYFQTNLPTPL